MSRDPMDDVLGRAYQLAASSRSIPAQEKRQPMMRSSEFRAATGTAHAWLLEPDNTLLQRELATEVNALAGMTTHSCWDEMSILEVLYLVMREAIKEDNEARKYFLKKLADRNKLSEELAQAMKKLSAASRSLAEEDASRGRRVFRPPRG